MRHVLCEACKSFLCLPEAMYYLSVFMKCGLPPCACFSRKVVAPHTSHALLFTRFPGTAPEQTGISETIACLYVTEQLHDGTISEHVDSVTVSGIQTEQG